jgi:transposase
VIVVGIDPHKKTHTAVAVDAVTGAIVGETTVRCDEGGRGQLVHWARGLDPDRTFAIEDCRHVSGRLERFLLVRGERVRRVPPKLTAGARRSGRARGKSDPIDATAVALAALREPDLPEASLAGPDHDVRLLLDHREDLVGERTRIQGRLRWHLHDLDLALEIPPKALDRRVWLDRLEAALNLLPASVQRRISLDLVVRCRELSAGIDALEREIASSMESLCPELLSVPGCGGLTAARILGETGGVSRFRDEGRFAMHAGVAPLPVSSGQTQRHRLNRQGNRQLNAALHRIAITQARIHEPAIAFLARKQAEGMSKREALRCLKRHLARVIFRTLRQSEQNQRMRVVEVEFGVEPSALSASA